MSPYCHHFPVMCDEVIDYVAHNLNGVYVDCTFGAGGHSRKLLSVLGKNAKLIGLDVDEKSIALGKELEKEDSRFTILNINFSNLSSWCKENNFPKIDGIIFDLGMSTIQIKDTNRGFSYMLDESYLDMRMNKNIKFCAADILNDYRRDELAKMFKRYGDIKNTDKLVNLISQFRKQRGPIQTSGDFKLIIENAFRKEQDRLKYFKKCFQALRIETNDEINVFAKTLDSLGDIMNKSGIVCVITFHSLEENTFFNWKKKFCDDIQIHDYSNNAENKFKFLNSGCIYPSEEELQENYGSKSAKLWVVRKN